MARCSLAAPYVSRSELKLHGNPGDDAEDKIDAKDAAPKPRSPVPFLVACFKGDGLEHHNKKSKAHGELGKQVVKCNGECKMKAVISRVITRLK